MSPAWVESMPALQKRLHALLTERRVFWVLFGGALLVSLLPIWIVTWPPLGDIGGHVELMDIVARYDDPTTAYREFYQLPHGINANSLSLYLATLLVPIFDALTVAKLLLSLSTLGLPLALLAVCRAFGRTDWLAFFAFPLTYSTMWAIGLVNYLLALPLLLLAVALARALGERGGVLRALLLGATLTAAFFAHALAFLIAFALSFAIVALCVRRFRHLPRLAGPLLSVPVFYAWYRRKFEQGEATEAGRAFEGLDDQFGAIHKTAETLMSELHRWGTRILREAEEAIAWDEIGFVLVVAIWLLLLAWGRGLGASSERDGWRFMRPLRRWSLEIVTLCCVVAYFKLPSHLTDVQMVTERVPIVFLLLFAVWPRIGRNVRPPIFLTGLLVAISFAAPIGISKVFSDFEREQVGPLQEAIEALPEGSFLSYVQWERQNPVFHHGALWHRAKGMHAVINGGVTDDSFARYANCPVQYREGMTPPRSRDDFWMRPIDERVDFVLVRSSREPQEIYDEPAFSFVFGSEPWWLFAVNEPDPAFGETLLTGGEGGRPVSWTCPDGEALAGFVGSHTDVIQTVRPYCRSAGSGPSRPRDDRGPQFGRRASGGSSYRLLCDPEQILVGIQGRSGFMVDALGITCRARDGSGEDDRSRVVGGRGGGQYDLRCPTGAVATGFRGRAGYAIDAAGVSCRPLDSWGESGL